MSHSKKSQKVHDRLTLCEKCPYSEFFWSVFSRIRTISPYSVRMWENTDQKNSEYEHFSRSVKGCISIVGVLRKKEPLKSLLKKIFYVM